MTILCGVDFSESSAAAAKVAALIAARSKLPLQLVHAVGDLPARGPVEDSAVLSATREALTRQAAQLDGQATTITLRTPFGTPEPALLSAAKESAATLLILSATGQGRARGIGTIADRLAQRSHVPTLVVRDPAPFEQWLEGKRPLRVLVGLDFNTVSEEAWRWAQELTRLGPVELEGVHVYWPPQEFSRLGLSGARSFIDPDPEIDRVLRRELSTRFKAWDGGPSKLRALPSIGRHADHLLSIANELKADLVVVGSHQRSALSQLWEGSVSRGVLHHARTAVACIPLSTSRQVRSPLEARIALAATDFSDVGNAAVEHAYAQVGSGGKVCLVHVLEPRPEARSGGAAKDIFTVSPGLEEAKRTAEEKLRSLVPMRAAIGDKTTEVRVLEAKDAASALTQAAERLGADVLCLGTHGRSGLSRAVLGSVAQGVMAKTQRPVLLVRPRET